MNTEADAGAALRAAAIALHGRKGICDVTVAELCREAHVARTTFYARYGNVDEPLAEAEDELVGALASFNEALTTADPGSVEACFLEGLSFVDDNLDAFRALLLAADNGRFVSKWRAAIEANLAPRVRSSHARVSEPLLLEVFSTSAVGFYRLYVENPGSVSAADAAVLVGALLEFLQQP